MIVIPEKCLEKNKMDYAPSLLLKVTDALLHLYFRDSSFFSCFYVYTFRFYIFYLENSEGNLGRGVIFPSSHKSTFKKSCCVSRLADYPHWFLS